MRKIFFTVWVSVAATFGLANAASAYDVDIAALEAAFATCVQGGGTSCGTIFTDAVAEIQAAELPVEELTDALAKVAAAIVEAAKSAEGSAVDSVLAEAMASVANAAVDETQKNNLTAVSGDIATGDVEDVDETALGSSPA